MKIYLRLEAPFEWVRVSAKSVEAFGEVSNLSEYPIGEEDEAIGVVPGEWVTTHRVLLPAKTRKQFNAALPYALEESISEDVENMHFICPNWKAGEESLVSVVAKEKMLEWQALANDNRLPLQQLVPEHVLVPFHEAADCSLALSNTQLLANHRDGSGVSIDQDFMDVWLMDVPMTATIAVNDEALTERLIEDHADRDFRHWPFGHKMAHWLEYAPSLPIDLWADKYRPRVSRIGKRTFVLPIMILLTAVVVKLGYDSYRYFSMHYEIKRIHSESQAILENAFPTFSNVTLGDERDVMEKAISRMGGPDQSQSMHNALADASKVLARQKVSLSNLVYRNKELVLTCILNDFSQVDLITTEFNRSPKLQASLQSSASEDGNIIASYSIKQK